jgi:hypothetical protein
MQDLQATHGSAQMVWFISLKPKHLQVVVSQKSYSLSMLAAFGAVA